MATTTATREKTVHVLARYELKRDGEPTGTVVYTVQSSDGTQTYKTTFFDGQLQSCECRGYRQWGHCYHGDELQKQETARRAALQDELPLESAQTTDQRYSLPLNGQREFSLLR